jgi:hypothetical protein
LATINANTGEPSSLSGETIMPNTHINYCALGALNDAINALNMALGRVADLHIPLELWAGSSTKTDESVKRWYVCLAKSEVFALTG